ncbi:MAG: winged helix-turn-helix domain-containing protein [Candidatus Bathyarchaeales archaeon]
MIQAKKRVSNSHRGRLDIIADILVASYGGVKKTYLMYQCNLSFRQLKYYLNFMIKKGLLQVVAPSGDSNPGLFEVTDKGRKFLKAYKSLKTLMK